MLYPAARDAMQDAFLDSAHGMLVYEVQACRHRRVTRWWDRIRGRGHESTHDVPVTYLRVRLVDGRDEVDRLTVTVSPNGTFTLGDE
jgi:hypothetical protein